MPIESALRGRRGLAGAVVFACVAAAPAATLYVRAPGATPAEAPPGASPRFTTIQEAIDAAAPGDVVIVPGGTYYETDIDFRGKAITVRSASGHGGVYLRPAGRGFHFHTGEGPDSVLQGFVIQSAAPAIHCDGSSPYIAMCWIEESRLADLTQDTFGLGMLCENGSQPVLEFVTFRDLELVAATTAEVRLYGAAFCCRSGSSPTLRRCDFLNNVAEAYACSWTVAAGAALACLENSRPLLLDCDFETNRVTSGSDRAAAGGAVYIDASSPRFERCTFENNAARGRNFMRPRGGGAVACVNGGAPVFVDCEIAWNESDDQAGGVYSFASSPEFRSCYVASNATTAPAARVGAGLYFAGGGTPRLEGCEIRNHTAYAGAAVYCHATDAEIVACRITSNTSTCGAICAEWHAGPHLARTSFETNTGPAFYARGFVDVEIENCYFAGSAQNPTIQLIYRCAAGLRNCTIARNAAGLTALYGSEVHLNQSILFGNTAHELALYPIQNTPAAAFAEWSCLNPAPEEILLGPDCTLTLGDGNLNQDPLLLPAYHWLQPGSPCIAAGNPAYVPGQGERDFDGQLRIWGGRVEIGADEFESQLPGDLNCDEALNALDIHPFILALIDPVAYASSYPACSAALADINGDGVANALDINPFVRLLYGVRKTAAGSRPDPPGQATESGWAARARRLRDAGRVQAPHEPPLVPDRLSPPQTMESVVEIPQ